MTSVHAAGVECRRKMFLSYSVLIGVAMSLVAFRVFAKWKYVRNVGPEDMAIVISLVSCFLVYNVSYANMMDA